MPKSALSRSADLDPDRAEGPVWVRNAWSLGHFCVMRLVGKMQKFRSIESKMRDGPHLLAGPRANAPVNGTMQSGVDIIFQYYGEDGREFYSGTNGVGWTQSTFLSELCTPQAS